MGNSSDWRGSAEGLSAQRIYSSTGTDAFESQKKLTCAHTHFLPESVWCPHFYLCRWSRQLGRGDWQSKPQALHFKHVVLWSSQYLTAEKLAMCFAHATGEGAYVRDSPSCQAGGRQPLPNSFQLRHARYRQTFAANPC